jgi:ABC-type branched-subunit amino acid transport system permease subunit
MIGLIVAAAPALAIGLFSLRAQSIFFAMATATVAYALQRVRFAAPGVPSKDGRSFEVPEALQLGLNLVQDKAFGVVITSKIWFTILASPSSRPPSRCC